MSEEVYRQRLLDRYHRPQYKNALSQADAEARVDNPLCGDWLTMALRIVDGRIEEAAWQGQGCAISLASVDLLCQRLVGTTTAAALLLTEPEVMADLGLPIKPARRQCAVLGLDCLQQALSSGQAGEKRVS